METSAKTGHNAVNLFNEAAKILYEKHKEIKEMKNKNKNSPYLNSNSEPIIMGDTATEDNDKNRKKCIC